MFQFHVLVTMFLMVINLQVSISPLFWPNYCPIYEMFYAIIRTFYGNSLLFCLCGPVRLDAVELFWSLQSFGVVDNNLKWWLSRVKVLKTGRFFGPANLNFLVEYNLDMSLLLEYFDTTCSEATLQPTTKTHRSSLHDNITHKISFSISFVETVDYW